MIKKNQILTIIILFFSLFSHFVYADVSYDENKYIVYDCYNSNCDELIAPNELNEDIMDSNLSIDFFLGKKYLLLTSKNISTANICYSLYLINQNNIEINESYLLGEQQSLCTYQKIGTQLINSFRDAAKWHDQLYEEKNGRYQLILEDECIGCGIIQRTYFDDHVKKNIMVTDNQSLNMRKPIVMGIVKKSYLLNTPALEDNTKMYLVLGDRVNLLKRQDDFYFIEYNSKKKGIINKWLHCSAIDACD